MKTRPTFAMLAKALSSFQRRNTKVLAVALLVALMAAACGGDDDPAAGSSDTQQPPTQETTTSAPTEESVEVSVRDSGMTVTVQPAGDLVVHTLTAPEQVFGDSTHIIETENSLVVVDTQFLLPMALDFRAYADGLGKPIDQVFITHGHPDHFLGSEAFADVPIFALEEVSASIAANGDDEVAEKQGEFGTEAIAGTFVVPEVVEAGTVDIDGISFELTRVTDAEAEIQLLIRVPEAGIVATGDIVYSGVHLILAGPADTWTLALNDLAADSDAYPIVLPGHGVPADPSVYDTNIAWLATAGELLSSVDSGEDFKQGLVDAFPDLGMTAAIDFVLPFLFPEE